MNFEAFKDAPWFDSSFRVTIGGLGNIGSWTSLLLARMGYELYLYDYDTVEYRNIGSQFYNSLDVGKRKDVAMQAHIENLTGNRKTNLFGKYDDTSLADNIMISCFDNMVARKIMFEKWLKFQLDKTTRNSDEVNIFIDGRSLAEIGMVYTVKSKSDAENYRKELFDDSEVEEQQCSFKSTSHNGAIMGGIITAVLVNHISNKKGGKKLRNVPFKTEWQLPLIFFT